MTTSSRLRGVAVISSVLLSIMLPASGVFAATPVNQGHSVGSARSAAVKGVSVCSLITNVDQLTVTRNRPLNHETFTFPGNVKSTYASRIRTLAKSLCALSVMPMGVLACPADLGVRYSLKFAATTVKGPLPIRPIVVSATGCQVVNGLSPTRWVEESPRFWSVFGTTIGLSHPTQATFVGKITNGS